MLVRLGPTRGSDIRKTRPCLIISPDELNQSLRTVIVAPMTTAGRDYPWRVPVQFQGKSGHVVLDQIRTINRERIRRRLGGIDGQTASQVLGLLAEMFAP